jgi:hypothetical protein
MWQSMMGMAEVAAGKAVRPALAATAVVIKARRFIALYSRLKM